MKKVLFIENDSMSKRKVVANFVQELADAREVLEGNWSVSKLPVSKLRDNPSQADLVLVEPSLAAFLNQVEKNYPEDTIVDNMNFLAYGTCNCELVHEQIKDLFANGKKPKKTSGKKQAAYTGLSDLAFDSAF